MKSAIRYGVLLGLAIVLLNVFAYLMGVEFAITYFGMITTAFYIVALVFVSYRIKVETAGVIKYFEAVKYLFTCFMTALLISSVFSFTFNNYIVPEYYEELMTQTMKKTEQMLEGFGVEGEALEQGMEEANKNIKKAMENPFWTAVQSILTSGVVLFVISLLAAIFVQRKPKEEEFLYEEEIIDSPNDKN